MDLEFGRLPAGLESVMKQAYVPLTHSYLSLYVRHARNPVTVYSGVYLLYYLLDLIDSGVVDVEYNRIQHKLLKKLSLRVFPPTCTLPVAIYVHTCNFPVFQSYILPHPRSSIDITTMFRAAPLV